MYRISIYTTNNACISEEKPLPVISNQFHKGMNPLAKLRLRRFFNNFQTNRVRALKIPGCFYVCAECALAKRRAYFFIFLLIKPIYRITIYTISNAKYVLLNPLPIISNQFHKGMNPLAKLRLCRFFTNFQSNCVRAHKIPGCFYKCVCAECALAKRRACTSTFPAFTFLI